MRELNCRSVAAQTKRDYNYFKCKKQNKRNRKAFCKRKSSCY